MKKIMAVCLLLGFSAPVMAADEQAKIELVRKIYRAESYSKYASPEFKQVVQKSKRIIDSLNDGELNCEVFEHYELGLGNGDVPSNFLKKLKIQPLKGNQVRVSFRESGYQFSEIFDIGCKNGVCQVNNIGKVKQERQQIIRTRSCS